MILKLMKSSDVFRAVGVGGIHKKDHSFIGLILGVEQPRSKFVCRRGLAGLAFFEPSQR